MGAEELVGRLKACPDEELAAVLASLTDLVEGVRRRVDRARLVALAQAAGRELADEPSLDAEGIHDWLGRDRAGV